MVMADNSVGKALAPVSHAGGGALRRLLDLAIDGYAWLPDVRVTAARALDKRGEHEAAIDRLVRMHIAMAGAQGFVTNIGGLATLVVAMPANIAGAAVLQMRVAAAIAHLRGYDLTEPRVRSAIMLCLLGPGDVLPRLSGSELPASPLLIATAPVFDDRLDREISEKVLNQLLGVIGGGQAFTIVARRIPVLGGGVGGALDALATQQIARYARDHLVARRRLGA